MSSPSIAAATGTLVVARYLDGRMIKGTTQDFAPLKPRFHVFPGGDRTAQAIPVDIKELKAVFFVKSFEGDPTHNEDYDFDRTRGHGRKAIVTFRDGETITGYTMGYHPEKPGFFLAPAEDESNNERVFVVSAAVQDVARL